MRIFYSFVWLLAGAAGFTICTDDARAVPPLETVALAGSSQRTAAPPDGETADSPQSGPNAKPWGPVHHNPHLGPQSVPFVSRWKPGTIVIHIRERRLYLVETRGQARAYPIGTARPGLDILGRTRITARRFEPSWTPTPNQRRRDPTLPRRVEPGPKNPLGMRALGLGWRYRLIHGTSDPSSIGNAMSDGCVRMLNEDVVDLYARVKVGTPVVILASADSGLVETRPPGYKAWRPAKRRWRSKRRRRTRRYVSRRSRKRR